MISGTHNFDFIPFCDSAGVTGASGSSSWISPPRFFREIVIQIWWSCPRDDSSTASGPRPVWSVHILKLYGRGFIPNSWGAVSYSCRINYECVLTELIILTNTSCGSVPSLPVLQNHVHNSSRILSVRNSSVEMRSLSRGRCAFTYDELGDAEPESVVWLPVVVSHHDCTKFFILSVRVDMQFVVG